MTSTDTPALEYPGEVVTQAHVRYVTLPDVAGPIALITLDNGLDHTRPSTFGPAGLRNLLAAMDEIETHAPAVAAIAVTGKPFVFSVGADLSFRTSFTDPQAVRPAIHAFSELGHAAMRRIGAGRLHGRKVPTFALVNGAALGGGLELALHCDYRAVSAAVRTLALPEVFLGLVPGWGGTQLLPNLVGADTAVTIAVANPLSQNRMLNAGQAAELGLADVLLEPADFLEEALRWAGRVIRGEIDPAAARTPVRRGQAWADAVTRGRALADAKLHGAAPAAYRALQLIELAETADLDAGLAAEADALADVAVTEELVASLYAFDLVQKRAKRPVGGPDKALARPVTKVGVVGAGLMASQLAALFAQRLEVPVVLTDIDQTRLDAGVAAVHAEMDNLLAKKKLSPDRASRLKASVTGSLTKDVFADADLVIEAVFEDLAVKRKVLAELEAVVSPTALLLTNTSALSISAMASELTHPERVAGLHFFNPVAVLPLVEVVRGKQTDDAAIATTLAVVKKLKKNAVLTTDTPAFALNRLLVRFMDEVLGAIENGTPPAKADQAPEPLGLPMSPLALLELVGPPIVLHVAETLHAAYPDRFGKPEGLARLVAAGRANVHAGTGDSRKIDQQAAELLRVQTGGDTPVLTGEQVREAALAALAEEIRILLDDGVVAEAADVDLSLILGAGWPFHLGGITPYLDRTGISEKVTGRRFSPPGVATI
ncbi:3-hydroxyacyl-CoA dehydrogenase NAD-binding domain-containing protein, partial [Frankia sp. Cj5]|uniref:3-hydroxyacyl-CoA dehydrogenase NAD-binding domain-containing protein n=1 Tax=Frankia sp. Cj5 TaxID=2880978 RepID=UPI001EF6A704